MEAQSLSTCNICGKKFQRKAHLLRHQQQHSGERPYCCKFCQKTFKRSDVLRDHFSRCERRGNSAIPNSLERGRKRHACDECSRLKVKCDNNVPCRKCTEFGRVCVKSRPAASDPDETSTSLASRSTPDTTPPDRNSMGIGFLLNGDSATDFLNEFPKSSTLSPNNRAVDLQAMMAARNGFAHLPENVSQGVPVYQAYAHSQMMPENNLDTMLRNLEFANFEQQTNNWQVQGENLILWSGADGIFLNRSVLETRAFDIKEKLRYTAGTMNVPHQPSKEVLEAIDHITPDSIAANIKLFFQHWYKHAPMIHEATFNPCTAALPLVMALMSLGGMYSKSQDVAELKSLLDIIEAYIFSVPGINDEYELPGRIYIVQDENQAPEWQQYQLEELQGAYLMIVLQFWSGNPIARVRVRQQRFQRVVSIFHHMDVLAMQHSPTFRIIDQLSFSAWVRRESYIRTANFAVMLDHSFGIFNNVSPRFQWAEIDLPFPCDDVYFKAANYAELRAQSLYPQQRMKVRDAYMCLFASPNSPDQDLNTLRGANLTTTDLQILVHYLYTHVWKSTFSNPMVLLLIKSIDELLAPFKIALRNWRMLWDEIKASFSEPEWLKLGFQRTAETYVDAVASIMDVFEKRGGKFPPISSDCEKGSHLRRLLTL